jgi:hypothetical protein
MAIPTDRLKDIAFSTNFRVENIHVKGTEPYTLGTDPFFNQTTVTIPHNLGYKPFFRVWVRFPGSTDIYYRASGPVSSGLVGAYQIEEINTDTVNLYVTVSVSASSGASGDVYYRIYKEPQA